MKIKKSWQSYVFTVFNVILLTAVTLCCLIPVWHVVCASVSEPIKLTAFRGTILWPLGTPTFGGYDAVFKMKYIWQGYANTLLYVSTATALGLLLNCFAAYGLSRRRLMLKKPINFIITFTMLFSGGLVPTYLVIRNLKMLNTIWAIILPNCVSVFNVMIMRNGFEAVPDELCEAAEIDGAGHFRTLFRIIIPVSKSIVAVVFLYYFIQQWNSWFHTSLYVTDRNMYPLQLWLRELVISERIDSMASDIGDANSLNLVLVLVKYCVIVVSILPMIFIYPFIQRYMVKGVMVGSVKG